MTPAYLDTSFVPAEIDCSDWSQVEPLVRDLLERPLDSPAALERWLIDRSELEAAINEERANLYIAMTCDTEDPEKKRAYLYFVEQIDPKHKPLAFQLDRRFVECPARGQLDEERYGVLSRDAQRDVELFREENVPIETELAQLDQQYQEICGAMTCEFDGRAQTMPQMARYLEEINREMRESAWRAMWERRLADADHIDNIYDAMIQRRHQVAQNAGYTSYRDYQHDRMRRFDYAPSDCEAFHESVEQVVVPVWRRLNAKRAEALGVDPLRPWDLAVDERGRPPLRPFEEVNPFIDKTQRIFERMDPALGELFARLREPGMLDLESRKGKAPGGYQYQRDRARQPFIFMNAVGIQRDIETLLHEGGHAFHSLLCADDPLLHYRDSPIEFAEVASMSMELLAHPYLDEFYSIDEANRARCKHLEGIIMVLPMVATIDAFQHWIYTHPDHTRDQRREHWLELDRRFGAAVSWDGLEKYRERSWQRVLHLFGSPFYFIEYGIAQIGALQLWLRYVEDPAEAIEGYKSGLSLGGSRPLPELWEATGLRFDFGPETMATVVEAVERELGKLTG